MTEQNALALTLNIFVSIVLWFIFDHVDDIFLILCRALSFFFSIIIVLKDICTVITWKKSMIVSFSLLKVMDNMRKRGVTC